MSKARQFFEEVKTGQEVTPLQAMKEGIQAVAPGLSWDKFVREVSSEAKGMVAHGAHELAAALFNGGAFVMYPRGNHDNGPEQSKDLPATEQSQGQQERDGMSM